MRTKIIIVAAAFAASICFATAANAQTTGAAIEIGGKTTISLKKIVPSIGIGQDVRPDILIGCMCARIDLPLIDPRATIAIGSIDMRQAGPCSNFDREKGWVSCRPDAPVSSTGVISAPAKW